MGAAGRIFGNGYQSQLFHIFFVYALRFEVCHQGIVVGGKAQAEFFEGFGRKAALFGEVFQPGSAVRHTQFAFKKGAGGFHNFIEGFALVFFFFVFGRKLRHLQTGLMRELLQRVDEREAVGFHLELDDVAVGTAAETVVKTFAFVDGKRRGLFVVERAESDKVLAPSAQVDIGRNDALYIRICAQLFEKTVAESHPFSPLSIIYTQKILFSLQSYQKI